MLERKNQQIESFLKEIEDEQKNSNKEEEYYYQQSEENTIMKVKAISLKTFLIEQKEDLLQYWSSILSAKFSSVKFLKTSSAVVTNCSSSSKFFFSVN